LKPLLKKIRSSSQSGTKYPYLKWQWIFYCLRRCFLFSITAKTFTGFYCI
jgi:hypothetical protein